MNSFQKFSQSCIKLHSALTPKMLLDWDDPFTKSLLLGYVGGVIEVTVGQPLDTGLYNNTDPQHTDI